MNAGSGDIVIASRARSSSGGRYSHMLFETDGDDILYPQALNISAKFLSLKAEF